MATSRPWTRRTWFDRRYVGTERRRANRLGLILFGSLALTVAVQHVVIGVGIVTDKSMLPTLHAGEYFLINKYRYRVSRPRRGDIVVLRPRRYESEEYVKRVIALPGETLQFMGGRVYLNGAPLHEPYAVGQTWPDLGPLRIAPDTYYVLGDNRLNSEDSRRFGAVPRRNLAGKIKPGEWFPFW